MKESIFPLLSAPLGMGLGSQAPDAAFPGGLNRMVRSPQLAAFTSNLILCPGRRVQLTEADAGQLENQTPPMEGLSVLQEQPSNWLLITSAVSAMGCF